MNKMKLYTRQIAGLFLALTVMSCEKMLDVDSTTSIKAEDHYSSTGEVYGAFIGLAAVFSNVAEQTVVLSELKGDLLAPTQNAPEDFWDIYRFKADNNTAYTSSKPYYDIVINCNDFLRRIVKYNQDVPGDIPENVYKGMVAAAVKYKVWSLFTIAQFWGEAQVYNSNLEDDKDGAMVTMGLDELPDYLLAYLEGGEDGINATWPLDWKLVLDNPDIDWEGCQLEYKVLKGELNLWAGNYQEAVNNFMDIIRVDKDTRHDLTDFWGGYWVDIFVKDPVNLKKEVITVAPFNVNYGQVHKLRSYFSNVSPNVYYMAPTEKAMKMFENQTMNNYSQGDVRGVGASYMKENGEYVVKKYHLNKDKDEYSSDATIHIYRAAQIHLNVAEAYCFMGKFEEALTFLDKGLRSYWTGNRFKPPFQNVNAELKDCNGVRGRVNLLPLESEEVFEGCVNNQDSVRTLCTYISDEVGLELAYEGKRWQTLIRMAKHLQDPSFLSKQVSEKFPEGERDGYKTFLDNEANWFIQDTKDKVSK